MFDYFIYFWLLPSLVVFLLIARIYSQEMKIPLMDFSAVDWFHIVIFSVLWPAGFVLVFVSRVWPFLVKEK